MKTFKNINIASNGSLYFYHNAEILYPNKSINFQRQDEKNFNFNQKEVKSTMDSKQSYYYKKKYLKR
jgi:hypothetical protein